MSLVHHTREKHKGKEKRSEGEESHKTIRYL
jgi:hypothetical protein